MSIKEVLDANADEQKRVLQQIISTSPKQQFNFPQLAGIYQPENDETPPEMLAEYLKVRYYLDAPIEVDSMEKFAEYLRESARNNTT